MIACNKNKEYTSKQLENCSWLVTYINHCNRGHLAPRLTIHFYFTSYLSPKRNSKLVNFMCIMWEYTPSHLKLRRSRGMEWEIMPMNEAISSLQWRVTAANSLNSSRESNWFTRLASFTIIWKAASPFLWCMIIHQFPRQYYSKSKGKEK